VTLNCNTTDSDSTPGLLYIRSQDLLLTQSTDSRQRQWHPSRERR